ncbi:MULTISPECIES: hypothetical protein [Malaciobacter]|jgi:hypothetical protein|uniref:Uncharacterized protein n=2 Tax=Malaciobacter TaxID=2321114 RepID=A0A1T5B252_9BACT|nr:MULTISPECIES: hypothetical protein [Malaciobacter]AXX87193.1 hypothetical protein AMRN_1457 [Malaciobacter marinus]PHO10898.1 hypothetical protein CPG37_00165 [Malaciobacter canalis]PHO12719.1 hypothetical protein CPG38_06495 [Malaciobacter marinus]PHO14854.1 hypothetical protein CPH92_09725 [Malaciobacter marinus]PPK60793.1 hypothetical protein B0F89_11643 [Malaciobacter marinus]
MTKEEEQEFIEKIKETIMPYAQNMTEEQIKSLVQTVQNQNQSLPSGFADMLLEQIRFLKYGKES